MKKLQVLVLCSAACACGTSGVDPRVLAMEKTVATGRDCTQDAANRDFSVSKNCEALAAGLAAEEALNPPRLPQDQMQRLRVASLQAQLMLWRAYAISADRKIYKPDHTIYDDIDVRIQDPRWFQWRRAECLRNKDALDCRSAPLTGLRAPQALYD